MTAFERTIDGFEARAVFADSLKPNNPAQTRARLEYDAVQTLQQYIKPDRQKRITQLHTVFTQNERSGAVGVILVAFNTDKRIEAIVNHGVPSSTIKPADEYEFNEFLANATGTRVWEVA